MLLVYTHTVAVLTGIILNHAVFSKNGPARINKELTHSKLTLNLAFCSYVTRSKLILINILVYSL